MDSYVASLARELNVKADPTWLRNVANLPSLAEAPLQQRRNIFVAQFLACDLNHVGLGSLPHDVKDLHDTLLEGEHLLQVDEMTNMTVGAKHRYEQDNRSRCLKLLMTDGQQQIFGFEYTRLCALKLEMPAGFKVIVTNALIRRGLLLLTPDNFKVLGGQVDRLEAARQRALKRWAEPSAGRGGQQGQPSSLYTDASAAAWADAGPHDTAGQPQVAQHARPPFPPYEVGGPSERQHAAPHEAIPRVAPGNPPVSGDGGTCCKLLPAPAQGVASHAQQAGAGVEPRGIVGATNPRPALTALQRGPRSQATSVTTALGGSAPRVLSGATAEAPQSASQTFRGQDGQQGFVRASHMGIEQQADHGPSLDRRAAVTPRRTGHGSVALPRGAAPTNASTSSGTLRQNNATSQIVQPPAGAQHTRRRGRDDPSVQAEPIEILSDDGSDNDGAGGIQRDGRGSLDDADEHDTFTRARKRQRCLLSSSDEESPHQHTAASNGVQSCGSLPLHTSSALHPSAHPPLTQDRLQMPNPESSTPGQALRARASLGAHSIGGLRKTATGGCEDKRLAVEEPLQDTPPTVVREVSSIAALHQWISEADAGDFPLLAAVWGSVKGATTVLQFMDSNQQPLLEYSMGAILTDGETDMHALLSHTLLQDLLGLSLPDLWTLLRDEGKAAVQGQINNMKQFLATFSGVMHVVVAGRNVTPSVTDCLEAEMDDA